jgi:hypothetical protein
LLYVDAAHKKSGPAELGKSTALVSEPTIRRVARTGERQDRDAATLSGASRQKAQGQKVTLQTRHQVPNKKAVQSMGVARPVVAKSTAKTGGVNQQRGIESLLSREVNPFVVHYVKFTTTFRSRFFHHQQLA